MDQALIELSKVNKEIRLGNGHLSILKDIDLSVRPGEFVAIIGASGSGKSTLLNILGLLDKPSAGSYHFKGKPVDQMKDDQLARIRNQEIGFVFQSFNLIPYYSALRNVEVPLAYASAPDRRAIARKLLDRVGLSERLDQRTAVLSCGEKHRVAIARALSVNPSLILADEPTGNLDARNADSIFQLLGELNASQGTAFLVVTHDLHLAKRMSRQLEMRDGHLSEETTLMGAD
jgi:lipoprotein-releasing system ATP-binding protein